MKQVKRAGEQRGRGQQRKGTSVGPSTHKLSRSLPSLLTRVTGIYSSCSSCTYYEIGNLIEDNRKITDAKDHYWRCFYGQEETAWDKENHLDKTTCPKCHMHLKLMVCVWKRERESRAGPQLRHELWYKVTLWPWNTEKLSCTCSEWQIFSIAFLVRWKTDRICH